MGGTIAEKLENDFISVRWGSVCGCGHTAETGSAADTGSGRSDKVNYPPGDRGRTGVTEKEDVDGDGYKMTSSRKK